MERKWFYCRDCKAHILGKYVNNHKEAFPAHEIDDAPDDWYAMMEEEGNVS